MYNTLKYQRGINFRGWVDFITGMLIRYGYHLLFA